MKIYGSTPELKQKLAAPVVFNHKVSREIARVRLGSFIVLGSN